MARKLASVRKISGIRAIPRADRLVVAQVDGRECVVPKDEFRVGDRIVYIETDSVVPERPEFEFLRPRNFMVRTIKLRGQVSQGLVLPMSVLPSGDYADGDDVTDVLGITKCDPQAQREALTGEAQNEFPWFMKRFKWCRRLFARQKRKSRFPSWISKTDEERIQNLPALFETESRKGTGFSVTEKMAGQSATYYLRRRGWGRFEFGVCSRNFLLSAPDNSSYWAVAKQYDIEGVLRKLIGRNGSVVMQGEICGRGIQGDKHRIAGYELFVFNLIFPSQRAHMATAETAKLIEPFGLRTVPIVEEGKKLPATVAELAEYSKGLSSVRYGQKRGGVVMRNAESGISFKVINPDFLLAERS
jgi:hypothetical protein